MPCWSRLRNRCRLDVGRLTRTLLQLTRIVDQGLGSIAGVGEDFEGHGIGSCVVVVRRQRDPGPSVVQRFRLPIGRRSRERCHQAGLGIECSREGQGVRCGIREGQLQLRSCRCAVLVDVDRGGEA